MTPQEQLEEIAKNDDLMFLQNVSMWASHRPLLLLALNLTEGDVTELGAGDGSTGFLRKYCEKHGRNFRSFDSNYGWAMVMQSTFIEDWNIADIYQPCGLLFVDEAPGENRHVSIEKMRDKTQIIVAHDSELNGAGNYMYEKVFKTFKYVLHYNRTGGGAGATALSNTIDLNQYRGLKLGGFQFEL
jgi:hypothetical protein